MLKKPRKKVCWPILGDASMLLGKISRDELARMVKLVVLLNEYLCDRKYGEVLSNESCNMG
jgi:hypothetical protein